jgi:hypothetical protein
MKGRERENKGWVEEWWRRGRKRGKESGWGRDVPLSLILQFDHCKKAHQISK